MIGVDVFREAFGKHEGKFVLIGGMAVAIQSEEAGLAFRPTKDFDVVLVVEALDTGFMHDFWAFVRAGGYSWENASGEKQFYRFRKPTAEAYPAQVELFARKPDVIVLPEGAHLTPIPADEDASSLSAILLDADYYECLLKGRKSVAGIPVLVPGMMVPFKAKAYLDLDQRLRDGQNINPKEPKKHRTDVFFLQGMLSPDDRIELTGAVKQDFISFLAAAGADAAFELPAERGISKADAIARFKVIYGVE